MSPSSTTRKRRRTGQVISHFNPWFPLLYLGGGEKVALHAKPAPMTHPNDPGLGRPQLRRISTAHTFTSKARPLSLSHLNPPGLLGGSLRKSLLPTLPVGKLRHKPKKCKQNTQDKSQGLPILYQVSPPLQWSASELGCWEHTRAGEGHLSAKCPPPPLGIISQRHYLGCFIFLYIFSP